MLNENRQAKRIMALMPGEEPVFIRAETAQYSAKLVNISFGGALISILDGDFDSAVGDVCNVFFSDGDRMFGVPGEVLRKAGRYVAFKFVDVPAEKARDIAKKISRMEILSSLSSPRVTVTWPASAE
jgi:hypothetical protein